MKKKFKIDKAASNSLDVIDEQKEIWANIYSNDDLTHVEVDRGKLICKALNKLFETSPNLFK